MQASRTLRRIFVQVGHKNFEGAGRVEAFGEWWRSGAERGRAMAAAGVELRHRRRTAAMEQGAPLQEREDRDKGEKDGEKLEVKSKGVGWGGAFCLLMIARYYSAMYNNIHDCDEVFNYWEPLHYLLYKSGFQTWEYRYGLFVNNAIN